MSRSPAHSFLSSFKPSFLSFLFFYFFIFLGYLAYNTPYTHSHKTLQILSPPPTPLFFYPPVVGERFVGCMCVCAMRVCRLVVLFHFLCLSSLSIHSFSLPVQLSLLFLSFPAGAALLEKVSYLSIHPSILQLSSLLSLFLPLCSQLLDWTARG